jgi:hypothetical protein
MGKDVLRFFEIVGNRIWSGGPILHPPTGRSFDLRGCARRDFYGEHLA